MDTNQTIDGVPRELLERITAGPSQVDYIKAWKELRALLDAPEPAWNPHPATANLSALLIALSQHGIKASGGIEDQPWVIELAAQPQGEPVAWLIQWDSVIPGFKGHREVVLKDPGGLDAVVTPLYAEQPAPAVKLHVKASYVKITANEDGSYIIEDSDVVRAPTAWSVRHASGKYGFVTLFEEEALKWASVRSDVSIHALCAEQPAQVAVVLPDLWQPIETAPKDGTEIILRKGDRVTAGAWIEWTKSEAEFHSTGAYLGNYEYDSGASWSSWDGGFCDDDHPTHWQPLPTATPQQ